MSVDPITMQQILKNLPEIQKRKLRAERARKQQERLQQMQDTPVARTVGHPTQMGGLYQTVGGYVPDTAAQAQRLVGGLGDFMMGRKADAMEEAGIDQTSQEIMNAQQQMSQMQQGPNAAAPEPGTPTRETLQAYLNQLGGGQGSIGLRVQSSYKADNGEIINIMSDGRHVPSGRFGDFNTKIIEGADGSVTAVGTSGAGRGQGQEVMMGGGQDIRTPPFAPPGTAAPAGAAPVTPGAPSNTGAAPPGLSRAERNNNPGNIEDRGQFIGTPGYVGSDGRFAIFDSPEAGIKAMNNQLERYFDGKTTGKPLQTVASIVGTWSPQSDPTNQPGSTANYANYVAQKLGVDPNAPLSKADIPRLAGVMAEFESGNTGGQKPPQNMAQAEVRKALRLPSKADESRMVTEAKIQTELAYAPQTTAAAVNQAAQVETVKLTAKNVADAKANLPKLESFGAQSRQAIEQLKNDPDLDMILGRVVGAIPDQMLNQYAGLALGQGGARVAANYNRLVGQVFLKGFETLKGGGQVTEIEGNKAQQAMSRMNRGMSKEDFIAAMDEFQAAVDEGIAKLRTAAAGGNVQAAAALQGTAPAPAAAPPAVSDLVSKYLNQGR